MTLTQANDLVDRCDRLFHRAAKALERGRHDGTLARSERQADAIRSRAEELLKPLGIVCDYPSGPYPTFMVAGGVCYTTEAAVSAALERNNEVT